MSRYFFRALPTFLLLAFLDGSGTSAAEPPPAPEAELVNIQAIDPTIVVDLRYASARNIARRPLYPPNMPALVRPQVAAQLLEAQAFLQLRGYRLKIWDAYRPDSAHQQLWQYSPNTDYVADPAMGGSLHTWGVAVDATFVDKRGRNAAMPTDFDDFTPAAMLKYAGGKRSVQENLRTLQSAMARAGFYGMRTEWWHFVSKEWKKYKAVPEVTLALRAAPVNPSPPSPPQARAAAPSRLSTQ